MELEPDVAATMAHLAARHGLDGDQHDQLARLLAVLAEERAPTSVHAFEEAVNIHIADSLVALEVEQVGAARTLVDLGAGAGLPGLPLAIALRDADVRLVESQSKKCLFLKDAVAAVGVENGRVVCVRAEEWSDGAERHDVVLARALAAQPVVLEYAAPLLRIGGALVDWRGMRNSTLEAAGERAARTLGLALREVRRVEPFAGARDHHLHVYEKVERTPARFPRRPGMARKRPLGVAEETR